MERFKGIVALDIDGTLTKATEVDTHLLAYLQSLYEKKWQIVFVTGRTFSFAEPITSKISVPHFLVVQNGSALFSLPNKKILFSHSLDKTVLFDLGVLAKKNHVALVIELILDGEDVVLYDPKSMEEEERKYIEYRSSFFKGRWISDLSVPFQEFLVAKAFGEDRALQEFIYSQKNRSVQSFFMRDPFRKGKHLVFLNSAHASKKNAVLFLQKHFFPQTKLIVAGDDLNDLSLLEIADYAIVMKHAPSSLIEIADHIIADPDHLIESIEHGIGIL